MSAFVLLFLQCARPEQPTLQVVGTVYVGCSDAGNNGNIDSSSNRNNNIN